MMECLTCGLTNELYISMQTLGVRIFQYLAPIASSFLGVLAMIFIGFQVAHGYAKGELMDRLKSLGSFYAAVAVAATFLAPINSTPLVYDWVVAPLEQLAAGLGAGVVDVAATDNMAIVAKLLNGTAPGELQKAVTVQINGEEYTNKYAILAFGIEHGISYILFLAWTLVGDNVAATLAGALLLIPFTFAVIVFVLYLVEVMFTFLAVGSLSPLLILAFPFPAMRPLVKNAWQSMLLATITLILACVVMGFGVGVVESIGRKISTLDSLQTYFQPRINKQNALVLKHCQQNIYVSTFGDSLRAEPNPDFDSAACIEAQTELEKLVAEFEAASPIEPGNSAYFVLLLVGGIFVLLLLRVKTLSSHLSGAQDSASGAAAVAAGTQALGAGALTAMKGGTLATVNEAMKASLKGAKGALIPTQGAGEGRLSPSDIARQSNS